MSNSDSENGLVFCLPLWAVVRRFQRRVRERHGPRRSSGRRMEVGWRAGEAAEGPGQAASSSIAGRPTGRGAERGPQLGRPNKKQRRAIFYHKRWFIKITTPCSNQNNEVTTM